MVIRNNLLVSADDAIFRDNKKFRAGSLSNHEALEFWRQEILQEGDVNEAARILSWLENSVQIEDFLKKNSEGIQIPHTKCFQEL